MDKYTLRNPFSLPRSSADGNSPQILGPRPISFGHPLLAEPWGGLPPRSPTTIIFKSVECAC